MGGGRASMRLCGEGRQPLRGLWLLLGGGTVAVGMAARMDIAEHDSGNIGVDGGGVQPGMPELALNAPLGHGTVLPCRSRWSMPACRRLRDPAAGWR